MNWYSSPTRSCSGCDLGCVQSRATSNDWFACGELISSNRFAEMPIVTRSGYWKLSSSYVTADEKFVTDMPNAMLRNPVW